MVVVLAVAAALTLSTAGPASAHATLIEATPSDGSVEEKAPTEVTLRFDEAVGTELGAIRVLAPDGSRVDTGQVSQSADQVDVIVPLAADLPRGTYTILWRVQSEDTHSIFGASTFSVGQASATSAATAALAEQAGAAGAVENLRTMSRLLLYLGLVVLLGGLAFVLVLWWAGREVTGARRLLWAGWGLAVSASAGGLLLQGPYGAGLPLESVLNPTLLIEVMGTRFGIATALRLSLLLLVGGLLWAMGRLSRPVLAAAAGASGLGLLVSTSYVGHAGAGSLAGLAVPMDVVHLGAICGWLGGLAMLVTVVLRRPVDLAAVLPRWSRYAAGLVVAVVISGAFAAWREVREWAALTETDYGRLLLLKVALVVGMLVLAGFGRWSVRRRLLSGSGSESGSGSGSGLAAADRGPAGAGELATSGSGNLLTDPRTAVRQPPATPSARLLRISVLVETVLAVVVLGVTSLLVATPPAVETYSPVVTESAAVTDQLEVQVQVDPARAGLVTLRLNYIRGGRTPTDVVAATARWTRLAGDDVVPVELARRGVGRYQIDRVVLPAAGLWQLAVTTQTSDIDSNTTLFTIDIR